MSIERGQAHSVSAPHAPRHAAGKGAAAQAAGGGGDFLAMLAALSDGLTAGDGTLADGADAPNALNAASAASGTDAGASAGAWADTTATLALDPPAEAGAAAMAAWLAAGASAGVAGVDAAAPSRATGSRAPGVVGPAAGATALSDVPPKLASARDGLADAARAGAASVLLTTVPQADAAAAQAAAAATSTGAGAGAGAGAGSGLAAVADPATLRAAAGTAQGEALAPEYARVFEQRKSPLAAQEAAGAGIAASAGAGSVAAAAPAAPAAADPAALRVAAGTAQGAALAPEYASVFEQLKSRLAAQEATGAGTAAGAGGAAAATSRTAPAGQAERQAERQSERMAAGARSGGPALSLGLVAAPSAALSDDRSALPATRAARSGTDAGGANRTEGGWAAPEFTPTVQYDAALAGVDGPAPTLAADERNLAEQLRYWMSQGVSSAEWTVAGDADPVQVSIAMQGNEASVSFRSEHAATRELLAGTVDQLRELLQSEGMVLSGVSVGAHGSGADGSSAHGSSADAGGARSQQAPHDAHDARSQASAARRAAPTALAAVAPAAARGARGSVDLFV